MTNGRVLSRDALFESVWGASKDADLQSRAIDVHIRSLRNKLGTEGRRIFTVRNVGYRLDPAPRNNFSGLSRLYTSRSFRKTNSLHPKPTVDFNRWRLKPRAL